MPASNDISFQVVPKENAAYVAYITTNWRMGGCAAKKNPPNGNTEHYSTDGNMIFKKH